MLHFFVPGMLNVPTVGASGAIYGLLLGFGMLYPNYTLTLLFPPVSLQAKWFVIIFAAIGAHEPFSIRPMVRFW